MKVFLTKSFSQDFTSPVHQSTFVGDFKDWLQEDRPCSYARFGRCWQTKVPTGHDFDTLWHLHLAPEDDFARWKLKLNSRTENVRCDRKSDNLLFFTEYNNEFLLIKMSNHAIMQPPMDQLNALCALSDAWVKMRNK